MNKFELISAIADRLNSDKKQVEKFLVAFMDEIREELINGNKVCLSEFGTFSVLDRAARVGRSPITGEPLSIPASKTPKFKPAPAFKKLVNGDGE